MAILADTYNMRAARMVVETRTRPRFKGHGCQATYDTWDTLNPYLTYKSSVSQLDKAIHFCSLLDQLIGVLFIVKI
jgi:hypothetical protein